MQLFGGVGERAFPVQGGSGAPGPAEATVGGFELTDHTADLGVVAWGKDLGEALAWSASGMFSYITNLDAVEPRDTVTVTVSAIDTGALAVDWLNELLFRYEVEGFLPKEYQVSVNETATALEARCIGETADQSRHTLHPAVKAATYHGLEVSHNGEWRVQVVLDI